MNIAYLSVDDPKDFKSWSGLKLKMLNTIKYLKHRVIIIGPLKNLMRIPFIINREIYKKVNIKYDSDRKFFLSKIYSAKINKLIKDKKIDIIFTSDTYLVSFLNTKIPIILWLDTTFKTYYEHYFDKIKIHKKSFEEANQLEKLALDKSKKIILTSKWAKDETIKNYKISNKKIHILPFGSNLNDMKKNKIKFNNSNLLNLISVGVDWDRKGMDKSIKITEYLNKFGVKTTLTIIGSKSKKKYPNFVRQIGFLNKNIKNDYLKLKKLYLDSDFHILMTQREACGVVYAEANSYGLFNITNDVGGVSGMIKNNFNGKLFNLNTSPKYIASYIYKIFLNKKKFFHLKKKSLEYYNEKLSWYANSFHLQKIFSRVLNNDN